MPADLIDFADARERFSLRVEERSVRNQIFTNSRQADLEAESRRECRRWLADLETWPAPFRRDLRRTVEAYTTPDNVRDDWMGAREIEEHRAGRRGGGFELEHSLMLHLTMYRGALRDYRVIPPNRRGRYWGRRRSVEGARRNLLRVLWTWGCRRIPDAVRDEALGREADDGAC